MDLNIFFLLISSLFIHNAHSQTWYQPQQIPQNYYPDSYYPVQYVPYNYFSPQYYQNTGYRSVPNPQYQYPNTQYQNLPQGEEVGQRSLFSSDAAAEDGDSGTDKSRIGMLRHLVDGVDKLYTDVKTATNDVMGYSNHNAHEGKVAVRGLFDLPGGNTNVLQSIFENGNLVWTICSQILSSLGGDFFNVISFFIQPIISFFSTIGSVVTSFLDSTGLFSSSDGDSEGRMLTGGLNMNPLKKLLG